MSLPYKIGSNGPEITAWQQWFNRYAKSYAPAVDGYFGNADRDATSTLQRKLQEAGKRVVVTGVYDAQTAAVTGFPKTAAPPQTHRPIWFFSAPGSGASWDVGPSFEVGKLCQDILHINHQPIGFPMGGYLGFMGGDPTFSYNEVIAAEGAELERLIATCPDLNDPNVEFWFSGYSQSADGMEDGLVRLFGDGGRFAHLRSRINGVIQFGNPSKDKTGIARKPRPAWLLAKVHNLNHPNDFYAEAPDEIRPAFYAIIVQAEMELPFFVHVLRIAIPIITQTIPIFGGILGPLAPTIVAGMAGISALTPLLGGLMGGMAGGSAGDAEVDRKIIDMLSVTGLIKNIPGLLQLVAALPGLQAHGDWGPFVQPGYDIVARFTR